MFVSRSGLFVHDADRIDRVLVALEGAGLPRRSDIYRLPTASGNHVYRVGEDFIVRLGDPAGLERFATVCEVQKAVQGRVPAAALLYKDLGCTTLPVPFAISEFVRGKALSRLWPGLESGLRERYLRDLVDMLVTLHGINYLAIPRLASQRPWGERQRLEMNHLLGRGRWLGGGDRELVAKLAEFWSRHEYLLDTAALPVLIHNARNPGNVIVTESGSLSLVDFDDADVAPWEIEYWSLCDELLGHGGVDEGDLQQLLRHCHGFDGPFSLERRKLNEALRLVRSLVQVEDERQRPGVVSATQSSYNACFVDDRYRNWFSASQAVAP